MVKYLIISDFYIYKQQSVDFILMEKKAIIIIIIKIQQQKTISGRKQK